MSNPDQFNPIHCISPPYMLNKLMQSSNQKIVDLAGSKSFKLKEDLKIVKRGYKKH